MRTAHLNGLKRNLKKSLAIFGSSHPNRKVCNELVVLAVCFSFRSYCNVKAVFYTGFRQDKLLPALPLRPSLQLWRQQEGSKKPHIFGQQANQGHCLGEMPGKHLQSSFHSCQARSGGRSRALPGFCVIVSPLIKVKLRRQPLPRAFIRHLQLAIAGNI